MSALRTKVLRILGVIFFIFVVLISSNLPTTAAPEDPCKDICNSRPNHICTYLIGHGYCIGSLILD